MNGRKTCRRTERVRGKYSRLLVQFSYIRFTINFMGYWHILYNKYFLYTYLCRLCML